MLTRLEKAILAFILLFNFALWVLFGVTFICFHITFSFSSGIFHVMTALDWKMAAQDATAGDDRFGSFLLLIDLTAVVINGLGLWMLSAQEYKHGEDPFLPIPRKLRVTIPITALQLYIVCYIYIKYFADYFRVWMHLVPLTFQSAALLILLAMGFYGLHKQRQNGEQNS